MEAATGYLDLIGETHLFDEHVNKLHKKAKQAGAVIVPSTGFDCVSFDLSVYFAAEELKKNLEPDASVRRVLCGQDIKGSVSGGTFASIVNKVIVPDVITLIPAGLALFKAIRISASTCLCIFRNSNTWRLHFVYVA